VIDFKEFIFALIGNADVRCGEIFAFIGAAKELARAKTEHPKVLTVEITVGQWGVSFWYRQEKDAGNIACNWPRAL
jgi:hypothetical protein